MGRGPSRGRGGRVFIGKGRRNRQLDCLSQSFVLVVGDGTRTVFFDFGTTATTGNWNNVTTSTAGTKVADAIDNSGAATGISLAFDKAWQGSATGQSGGTAYPASAMTDGFYITGTQNPITVTLGGLDPARLYDLRIFGSTQNTGNATRTSAYTAGGTTQTLVAAQNANATVTFTGLTPVSGSLGLTVALAPGSTYAYLNVLGVTARLPDGPAITSQPAGVSVESGDSTILQVAAIGPNLTYQWYLGRRGDISQPVAGATSATFQTPALTQTSAYWVRVSNTGGFDDSDAALVTVANPGYASWAADCGLAGEASAPNADPDSNGVMNLFEYAFAIAGPADIPANMPAPALADSGSGTHAAIQFTRRKNAADLQIIPEYSADLTTWHTGEQYLTTVSTTDNQDGTETVTVRGDANLLCHRAPTLDGLGAVGANLHISEHDPDKGKFAEFLLRPAFAKKALLNCLAIRRLLAGGSCGPAIPPAGDL